jgi:hypothetical protein
MVVPTLYRVAQDADESLHIGTFFGAAEKLSQKEDYRVVSESQQRMPARHNGADERKFNRRSYEPGKAVQDAPVGTDFDMAALIGVF